MVIGFRLWQLHYSHMYFSSIEAEFRNDICLTCYFLHNACIMYEVWESGSSISLKHENENILCWVILSDMSCFMFYVLFRTQERAKKKYSLAQRTAELAWPCWSADRQNCLPGSSALQPFSCQLQS